MHLHSQLFDLIVYLLISIYFFIELKLECFNFILKEEIFDLEKQSFNLNQFINLRLK